MSPRLPALLLLITPFCLSGCGGAAAPTFTVVEAYVAERTDQGARVNIAVDAHNTSSVTIPLWNMTYVVDIAGGTERATISRWAQTTLAPHSTLRFEVPVVTRATGPSSVRLTGVVTYVPGGRIRELLTEVGLPLPSAPVTGAAPVNLDESPRPPAGTATRVISARHIEAPPTPVIDTLPPLKNE